MKASTRTAAAVTLVTVLVLAGCNHDPKTGPTVTGPREPATAKPAPTTPTVATPEPAASDTAADDAAAIQAFVDYIDIGNEVGHGYYYDAGVERLMQLTTGDYDPSFAIMKEQGAHQVGTTTLSDFVVVGHEPSEEGMSSVIFEVCIDSRGVDIVRSDGSSMLQPFPDSQRRVVSTITMWFTGPRQGGEPAWRVAAFETDRGRPC